MKIILSQKGFDSTSGGHPSPIIGNRLVSLPIPEIRPKDYKNNITYKDLRYDSHKNYFDLMKELNIDHVNVNSKKLPLEENNDYDLCCHLDPDIKHDIYPRKAGWKPLFGQVDTAQTHLEKQINGDKDVLFLFYGLFRKKISGINNVHVIYGFLEVDRTLPIISDSVIPQWMQYHPHVSNDRYGSNNTIYIGKRAGTFHYNEKLELTKNGCNKVSHWDLFRLFDGYLKEDEVKKLRLSWQLKNSWMKNKNGEEYYKYCRGQEKCINLIDGLDNQVGDDILNQIKLWSKDLIRNYSE